ncbi:MAG: NAD-dependent epimerase/dehydratase family protein [Chloroflexota bacterium]
MKTVLVTGGAGYIGAVLIPKLLERDYRVRVLDLFVFGESALPREHSNLESIRGDIRDLELLERIMPGTDGVIHLAGISNDPGFELNPRLGKSINFESFEPLVSLAKECGVQRFIYASSASVYGLNAATEVTEDEPLLPITDYDRYKSQCEPILHSHQTPAFTTVVIRSATVCGYSPRQRLDLVVNILTNLAVHRRKITILGAEQQRPSLHVEDLTDLYANLLESPAEVLQGHTFNVAGGNHSVAELSRIVCDVVRQELPMIRSIDLETAEAERAISYKVCATRIQKALDWRPRRGVEDAVVDLCRAFRDGRLPNSLDDPRYFNVRMLQTVGLV